MTQDLCHGKVDITSFPEIPSFPNPTSGARSTELGKNNENKPKCWKIANNSYPVYHLCAQRLPNPYNEFLKSLYLFEEGNFIYDKFSAQKSESRKVSFEHTESGTLGSSHPFLSQSATQFSEDPSSILTTTWKRRRIPNSPRLGFPPLRGSAAQFSTLH
uniref:Uncharacterized protein n=1 Tax=Fagus sylvatica TaxID=28930 RepID=A0A2N9HP39_FAGSY